MNAVEKPFFSITFPSLVRPSGRQLRGSGVETNLSFWPCCRVSFPECEHFDEYSTINQSMLWDEELSKGPEGDLCWNQPPPTRLFLSLDPKPANTPPITENTSRW